MDLLPHQPLDKNALDAYRDDADKPKLRTTAFLFLDLPARLAIARSIGLID